MTATTYTHNGTAIKRGASFGGWLSRLFDRMVEAQTLRARKMVAQQLSTMSDAHLKDLGFAESDIERLRMDHPVR